MLLKVFAAAQLVFAFISIGFLYPVVNQELLIPTRVPNLRYLAFSIVLMSAISIFIAEDYDDGNYLLVVNCFSWLISCAIVTNHRRQYVLNWMNIVFELLFTSTLIYMARIHTLKDIIYGVTLFIRSMSLLVFILTLLSKSRSKYYYYFKKLMPYLVPKKELKIQIHVCMAFMWLLVARVVNVLLPLQYKRIIDSLSGDKSHYIDYIVIYFAINLLQGGNGYISSFQSFSFIPVRQWITKSVGVSAFSHLHHLSMSFHINRKTGEILRIMDRGTSSVSSILSSLVFNILPIIIDITVAITYFVVVFNVYFGLILFIALFLYIFFTITITEWRSKLRREMINADNKMSQIAVDSLLNFETVKLYNAEQFETDRYSASVDTYNKSEFKSSASLNLLNATQNTVICTCTLVGALYAGYLVNNNKISVGDFVMFIAYLQQLYQPLNFFGTFYRMIAQNLVDLEKLMDLLDHEPEIKDDTDAGLLKIRGGEIKVDDLSFSYDGQSDALKHVSFTIPAGKSAAIVGQSGSGKSTLMKLLFRFYEISRGSIEIDQQPINKVTQSSLRSRIGIVPQDCVLFNDSILYNVGYSRPNCTKEDIYEACKMAQIHDKIMTFPDQYNTQVGERGLRLSGGEKQRIAIARTFLKNPAIIFFDEVFLIHLGYECIR